jgi:general secretion pathway protein C
VALQTAADTALEGLVRLERPLRRVVECVLVAVLALLVARLAWLVIAPSDAVASFTERPLPSPIRGLSGGVGLSADRTMLLQANPFDQDDVELVVPDAPETTLNLRLDGLRMSTQGGEAGNAIIRTPDGRGENYSVGDEILAGVRLDRILSDRVIINRDGASETLMLGGRGAGLSVISDESLASASAGSGTANDGSRNSVIDGYLASPSLFFGNINAALVRNGGAMSGYRLSPTGGGAEIMRQAGLEPGDVLLQVNGTSATQLDINDMVDRMMGADSVDLQVSRDGTERTIRLRFGD